MKYRRKIVPHKDAEIRRLLFVIYFLQGYDREWIQHELHIGRSTYFNYKKFGEDVFKINGP